MEKITSKPIKYVSDTISLEDTQKQGDAILTSGGYLTLVLPPSVDTSDKHFVAVLAFRKLDENVEALSALYGKLTEWLESGVIQVTFLVPLIFFALNINGLNFAQPNRVEVLPNGLNGIVDGLKKLEENKVSGVKLVARPEETN